MRKGSIHVDWAMSMGIFLVSLIALFVFLKPGIREEHREDLILDLVQKGFEENTSTRVEKIPLIIEKLDSANQPNENQPEINIHPITSGWSIVKFENVKDSHFETPVIDGNDFILKCNAGICSTKNNEGIHEPIILTFYKSTSEENILEINEDICSTDECDAQLGLSESIEGLNRNWIDSLFTESDYEYVKSKWGVPLNKDFGFYQGEQKLYGSDAPETGNIFARNSKYWLLNTDGTRDEYAMVIILW